MLGCLRLVDCESGNCRSMWSLHACCHVDLCSGLFSSSTCFPQMTDTWASFVPPLLICSVKWCFSRCGCKEVQWLLQEAGSLDRTCLQAVAGLSLYEHLCSRNHRHQGLFWSREVKAQLPTSFQCHHLWKTSNCYLKANCRSGQPHRHLNEVATCDPQAVSQEEYQHGYLLMVWSNLS